MSVAIDTSVYSLQIPNVDKSFFIALTKKMGWVAKRQKENCVIPTATVRAINEARSGKDAGKVDMTDMDSFLKSME